MNNKGNLSPFDLLKKEIRFLPEFYKTGMLFGDCVKLIENNDSGAIDAIITLTKIEGHYFSEEFWKTISKCATILNLPNQAIYCKDQIKRNAIEVGFTTIHGWTTVKSSGTHYEQFIANVITEKWESNRRRKDNVSELMKENGFHLVPDGRCATIYYVENCKLIEISAELSGSPKYDIIIFFESLTHYALPEKIPLTTAEKSQLKTALMDWLKSIKITSDLS